MKKLGGLLLIVMGFFTSCTGLYVQSAIATHPGSGVRTGGATGLVLVGVVIIIVGLLVTWKAEKR